MHLIRSVKVHAVTRLLFPFIRSILSVSRAKKIKKKTFGLSLETLNIDLMKENNNRVAVLLSPHLIKVHRLHFFMSNLIVVNSVRRNIVRAMLFDERTFSVSHLI
jgi:hypothetical protein